MCTILVARGQWPDAPLVIAANRDEALGRPAAGPQVYAAGELSERRVLAPRDLKAGGTWLGLNDAGLFVGITNRRTLREDKSRRSRGELVTRALGASDPDQARARIFELRARDYNPFHLLLADRNAARIVWGDGEQLHQLVLDDGIDWITERSFGAADSRRHGLLAGHAADLAAGPKPDRARWRSILADHRPHRNAGDAPGMLAIGLDAMCVHARPLNYGTRSSTLIELGPAPGEVGFFHASGRPCEHDFVDYRAAVTELMRAG